MTMMMCGLFSFIDEDLRELSWIPRFLRNRPFLIGFFLLHVPVATVIAVNGALDFHRAQRSVEERSRVGCASLICCGSTLRGSTADSCSKVQPMTRPAATQL